eukprot:m51a1_g496 hypothetical protein (2138) ;mRNA; r:250627-259536
MANFKVQKKDHFAEHTGSTVEVVHVVDGQGHKPSAGVQRLAVHHYYTSTCEFYVDGVCAQPKFPSDFCKVAVISSTMAAAMRVMGVESGTWISDPAVVQVFPWTHFRKCGATKQRGTLVGDVIVEENGTAWRVESDGVSYFGMHPEEEMNRGGRPNMLLFSPTELREQRKLIAVFDLDHTLCNSSFEPSAPLARSYRAGRPEGEFSVEVMGKRVTGCPRPFLRHLLEAVSPLYHLFVYTSASREYTHTFLSMMNVDGFFGQRVFTADDIPELGELLPYLGRCGRPARSCEKIATGLDEGRKWFFPVFGDSSTTVISTRQPHPTGSHGPPVDNSWRVWWRFVDSVLYTRPFLRYTSRWPSQILPWSGSLEFDPALDTELLRIEEQLVAIHRGAFENANATLDVLPEVRSVKAEALCGVSLLLSGVFGPEDSRLEKQVLRFLEQLGATVSLKLREGVTHVVATEPTSEARETPVLASVPGVYVVEPGWLVDMANVGRRVDERMYAVRGLPVTRTADTAEAVMQRIDELERENEELRCRVRELEDHSDTHCDGHERESEATPPQGGLFDEQQTMFGAFDPQQPADALMQQAAAEGGIPPVFLAGQNTPDAAAAVAEAVAAAAAAPVAESSEESSPSGPVVWTSSPPASWCVHCEDRLRAMRECCGVQCQAGARKWEENWRASGQPCFGACTAVEFCADHGFPLAQCTALFPDAKHNVFLYRGTWVKQRNLKHELDDTPQAAAAVAAGAPAAGGVKRQRYDSPQEIGGTPPGPPEGVAVGQGAPEYVLPNAPPMPSLVPPIPMGRPCEKRMECFFRLQKLRAMEWAAGGAERLRELEQASVLACQGFCKTPYCCRVHWCPAYVCAAEGSQSRYRCPVASHDVKGKKNRAHADFPFYCADEGCCNGKWYSRDESHHRKFTRQRVSKIEDHLISTKVESNPRVMEDSAGSFEEKPDLADSGDGDIEEPVSTEACSSLTLTVAPAISTSNVRNELRPPPPQAAQAPAHTPCRLRGIALCSRPPQPTEAVNTNPNNNVPETAETRRSHVPQHRCKKLFVFSLIALGLWFLFTLRMVGVAHKCYAIRQTPASIDVCWVLHFDDPTARAYYKNKSVGCVKCYPKAWNENVVCEDLATGARAQVCLQSMVSSCGFSFRMNNDVFASEMGTMLPMPRAEETPDSPPPREERDYEYRLLGTEFKERDQERAKPVWDQTARDESGRQRFHGAFTGGFSAGYYNTVGSAEGWTPQEFKSTRGQRAQRASQTAEDFMDDEDKRERLAERLTTRAEYSGLQTTAVEIAEMQKSEGLVAARQSGAALGPAPSEFFVSTQNIGFTLLRRMGWREGRGIGGEAADNSRVPSVDDDEPEVVAGDDIAPWEVAEAKAKQRRIGPVFTPQERRKQPQTESSSAVSCVEIVPKNDVYGLGYDPAMASEEYREMSDFRKVTAEATGRQERSSRGQKPLGLQTALQPQRVMLSSALDKSGGAPGLGLGALDDDDDGDVFGTDKLDSYDIAIDSSRERKRRTEADVILGGLAAESKRRDAQSAAAEGIIAGFVAALQQKTSAKWFAPPVPPRDFKAYHYFEKPVEQRAVAPGTKITPEMRSRMLGEAPLPRAQVVAGDDIAPWEVAEAKAKQRRIGPVFTPQERRKQPQTESSSAVSCVEIVPKNDVYGLGYDPAMASEEYREMSDFRKVTAEATGRQERSSRGQKPLGLQTALQPQRVMLSSALDKSGGAPGLGLGALDDDDDGDVFGTDKLDSYDIAIDSRRERKRRTEADVILGGLAAESKRRDAQSAAAEGIIAGFVAALQQKTSAKWFAPPVPPRDFKAYHYFEKPVEQRAVAPGTKITPEMRSRMLGEAPLPRAQVAAGAFGAADPRGAQRLPDYVLNAPVRNIYSDAKKQRRYEDFVKEQRGDLRPQLGPPAGMSAAEWTDEREEFVKTAIMFRPMAGAMASRFAPAQDPVKDVYVPGQRTVSPTERKAEAKSPEPAAVPQKRTLVRTQAQWAPVTLLCKRFNVPNPHPGKPAGVLTEERRPESGAIAFAPTQSEKGSAAQQADPGQLDFFTDVASAVALAEAENGEINEPDRPPIDIFKAIFEDPTEEPPQPPQPPQPSQPVPGCGQGGARGREEEEEVEVDVEVTIAVEQWQLGQ